MISREQLAIHQMNVPCIKKIGPSSTRFINFVGALCVHKDIKRWLTIATTVLQLLNKDAWNVL